jgi:hypothetical protein
MLREAELEDVRQELKKVTEINLDHEVNKMMDPVRDPAIAGAAPTVPQPEVPDYLDHTPAPADPVPPAIEHVEMAPGDVEMASAIPAEHALPEPEHVADPGAPSAEEHSAPATPPKP